MAQEEKEQKRHSFGKPTPGERTQYEPEEEEEVEVLDDDATVDVEAERKETNTDEVLERMERELVGLKPVKTRDVLKRAMGGVLFIDEAYYLYRAENERDYGQEAIEILLQIMENERENIVVILAGYKDKMDVFFSSNPGMGSRIAHHIDFPDYSVDELVAIAKLMLQEQQYEFSPEAEKVFRDYLSRRIKQPRFANARSVRNAIERARLRQASRLVQSGNKALTKQDLLCIDAEDILQSRVFSDEEELPPDEADDGEVDKGDIDHAERSGDVDDVSEDGQGGSAESDSEESDEQERDESAEQDEAAG